MLTNDMHPIVIGFALDFNGAHIGNAATVLLRKRGELLFRNSLIGLALALWLGGRLLAVVTRVLRLTSQQSFLAG